MTLTGACGVGRTRLAYRAATELRHTFPDGVWLAELAELENPELLQRASVFAGGMELEAAEAVCSGDGIDRAGVLDLVTGLVDKSVLLREECPLGIRYRLLESLREYGRDRLTESGAEAAVRRRYRDFYRHPCSDTRDRLFGPAQAVLITRLKLENANLRSVLDQLLSSPGPDGLHMAADLRNQWLTGYLSEGRQRLRQGLAVHRDPDEARGRALVLASLLAVLGGEADVAGPKLAEARDIGERLRHGLILADVALYRGLIAIEHGDAEAAFAEEGIVLCEAHGEVLYRSHLTLVLGIALWRGRDTARAREPAKESPAFNRSIGNPLGIAFALALLTWVATTDGRYERAARLLAVLEGFSRRPWSRGTMGSLVGGHRHLGRYHDQCVADIRRALGEESFEAAARRTRRLGADQALAYAMEDEPAAVPKPVDRERSSPLTRRETEVARLVARGVTNKDIAAELTIGTRTVEGHVEHILGKLGFGSRTQIAVWMNDRDHGADTDRT